ncbi:3-hydroxyacyl-ACP dehydratase [Saccharopolyspora sp. NFXS83]|uniref:3-hydroxyacyl-ACP dehydratase FabZ family protein n=1 Tax=Saccharopolyspora sp. NFXS83 TaxID=2993560 RepID=UPI00224B964C|nr:3-hydroxyacyl-ACP dehydratase [Saccharopolyspora sp. NFXS83]MCX2732048.1 3-hydroxyacyl-ACP dehydratase [Saccharopolyspora sp. NFXS83]
MTGQAGIRATIPHRHPILLVDRVVSVDPGARIRTRKAISGTEHCYAGLPEDAPEAEYAYPLSRLLESWAQSAVLLASWQRPNADVLTGQVELLTGLRGVELLEPVFPGDVVEHEVIAVRELPDAAIFRGECAVDGRIAVRVGQLTVARRGAEVLRPGGADAR